MQILSHIRQRLQNVLCKILLDIHIGETYDTVNSTSKTRKLTLINVKTSLSTLHNKMVGKIKGWQCEERKKPRDVVEYKQKETVRDLDRRTADKYVNNQTDGRNKRRVRGKEYKCKRLIYLRMLYFKYNGCKHS